MTIKIRGKVVKVGNSYAMLLPKALIDAGIIPKGEKITIELTEQQLLDLLPKESSPARFYTEVDFVDKINPLVISPFYTKFMNT